MALKSDILQAAGAIDDIADAFAGKTVLLCGGRGFIGRYLCAVLLELNQRRLKKNPCTLLVLDNLITSGKSKLAFPKTPHFRFMKHNIIEPFTTNIHIDFILQTAGIASPYYYRAYPLETLEVAIAGTKNMLELAEKNRSRLLFFSSSEIYGDPDPKYVPTRESYRGYVSCLGPRACYDESKRLGETLCYVFHEKFGTAAVIVRPFNVFGPGMQEADYRILPNIASRIKAGKPVNIYGTGKQTRTFCYITDAIEGFLRALALGLPGEAYNIGNPKPEISMTDLIKIISRVLGRPVAHHLVEYPDSYPADEPNRRCPDITKAKLQLGFKPKVPLEEGLERFFTWTEKTYTGNDK
ncbi:MAG: NAD-dependent epimerase/dehydratase family protein [Elusimicrobia bacterium]|nr:NAD-dependent epimerase/dehydratase family protein [Elusimicrobiota bacterium]